MEQNILKLVNEFKNCVENASDEWETVTVVEEKIKEFEDKYETKKKKKNKIK